MILAGLTLHPDKTRLVDFRPKGSQGARHPETDGTTFGIVPFDHGLDRGTGDPVIGQVEGRPRGDGKRSTQVCT